MYIYIYIYIYKQHYLANMIADVCGAWERCGFVFRAHLCPYRWGGFGGRDQPLETHLSSTHIYLHWWEL